MLISIDNDDPRPIYLQIVTAVKQQLLAGVLQAGDELPSVRELSQGLGINLHTVRHAYKVLSEQGIVRLGLARRARVLAPPAKPPARKELEQTLLPRLRELVADASRLGATGKDLHRLMKQAIASSRKGTGK